MHQYVSWCLLTADLSLEVIWAKHDDFCKLQTNEVRASDNATVKGQMLMLHSNVGASLTTNCRQLRFSLYVISLVYIWYNINSNNIVLITIPISISYFFPVIPSLLDLFYPYMSLPILIPNQYLLIS